MKKIQLLIIMVLLIPTIVYSQYNVNKLRLKLKMFSLGAMNWERPSIKKPELYPNFVGDVKLFGNDFPKQNTRMNLTYEQKNIKTDTILKKQLRLVSHVLIELRNNPAGTGFGNFSQIDWIDTNGYIIGLYGGSVDFSMVPRGNYWVAIHLPNTFPVLSPISFYVTGEPGQIIQWDFTDAQNKCWGNCLYEVYPQPIWATMTCDVDETGILDMGDLSILNNNLGYEGYNKCDVDFNNKVDTVIDWTFLLTHFFEMTTVPSPFDYKIIKPEGEEPTEVKYILKATNFIKQNNKTIFDINICRTSNLPINLRSLQCVFRYVKNQNLNNLEILYNRNFWQIPKLLTDSALIVSGLCFPDSSYLLDTIDTKLFTISVEGNLDSLRWGNNTIQRTKLFMNPGYVEFTNPDYHFIDFLTNIKQETKIINNYKLFQNHPNPFNPSTTIDYEIPYDCNVNIKVYDISGKEIMTLINTLQRAGHYSILFNADKISSGVYFYKLETNNYVNTKKFIIIK